MQEFICSNEAPIVSVKQGRLKGYYFQGVYRFFGVPYARSRRFEMPQEPRPWEGIRNANAYGYICPVLSSPAPSDEISVPHRFWPENEHCQNLNVYTSALDDKKRPVLVWLHGGGFSAGSAIEQIAYDGDSLAKNDDVVVVTVNHRLNAFGFLDVSAFGEKFKYSGTVGMADLVAALQWVHDNIAVFGGDPENVTIFGQSGGGHKVWALGQIPAADGLFHKGIIMSGVSADTTNAPGLVSGEEFTKKVMEIAGVTDIEGLQKLNYQLYIMAVNRASDYFRKEGRHYAWEPVANGYFVGNPFSVGFREHFLTIPTIVGTCASDIALPETTPGRMQLSEEEQIGKLAEFFGDEEKARTMAELYKKAYPGRPVIFAKCMDMVFTKDSDRFVREKSEGTAPVWRYQFGPVFNIEDGKSAWHCSDIGFAFHNSEILPYCYSISYRERLEREFCGAVLSFARTGDPNHADLPEWKPSTKDDVYTMFFDEKTEARVNFDNEALAYFLENMPARSGGPWREKTEGPDDEPPVGSWAY